MELATTEAAWASASGSRPSASIRSIAPWRWAGFTLSRSVRQLSASRTLKKPTGTTAIPRRPLATEDCVPVTSTRPASPSGQSPSRSAVSCRSSRTTSHDWSVAPSQLTRRAATDSAVPAGSMPKAAAEACTYPESTDARFVAEIQISASMAPDRHSDSAMITAIWVLPQAPSQFDGPSAKAEPGTSARVVPGTSVSTMPRAVSGRSVYPSASGGTSPTRNR